MTMTFAEKTSEADKKAKKKAKKVAKRAAEESKKRKFTFCFIPWLSTKACMSWGCRESSF